MKILLELSYVGARYAGFQVQPNQPTVQSALQDALERVYGERLPIKGCSRTDAGVHALQYFAAYDSDRLIPPERIPAALNSALPEDIAIRSARIVPDTFHVRHDVAWKEYEYLLHNSPIRDPFYAGRAFHLPHIIADDGIERMKRAAGAFIGRKDFIGFMSAGSSVSDTVREIKRLDIIRDGDLLRVRIAADGFLYNMVRIIVGTLLEAARGRIDPDEMNEIIASRDRRRAGFTAPPEGLYLRRVEFKEGVMESQGSHKNDG